MVGSTVAYLSTKPHFHAPVDLKPGRVCQLTPTYRLDHQIDSQVESVLVPAGTV